jgi:hypothetical protein
MSATISWRHLKVLLGIENLFQYKDFLGQCPEFSERVRILPSKTTRSGFDYGILEQPPTNDVYVVGDEGQQSAMDDTMTDNTNDEGSYVFPNPDDFNNSTGTSPTISNATDIMLDIGSQPDQTDCEIVPSNVQDTPRKTNTLLGTNNNLSLPDNTAWGNTREVSGFQQVHYRNFESIITWMQQDTIKHHPFSLKWQRAVFAGLTALSKWEQVAHLFQLTNIGSYINLVYECPHIPKRYELTWDFLTNTIRCTEKDLPAPDDAPQDMPVMDVLQ